MAKLKVFRTTIGFHDAYVAAPSRAAALRAWGATTDLFAMAAAEEVIEPALMKKPLADPGRIVKKSRGTAADHMAVQVSKPPGHGQTTRSKAKPPKPKPLPSRQKLDAADKRLTDAKATLGRAKQKLDDEQARLASRRRTVEHEHQTRIATLQKERDREEELHREALDRWRAESD
ncbi:MAG: hypothetical protein NVS3B5_08470 [Sphingomicrobium sp.]